jgi:transcription antitermination factor NusG
LILEFNDRGESATYPEIVAAIQTIFGPEVEYFVPIHHEEMGSYVSMNVLFEGYAFVKDSQAVRSRILNIKEGRIFSGFLRQGGRICEVDSRSVGVLKRKLKYSLRKKFAPGMSVRINEGVFQNLEGEVISTENNGRIANVKIRCISREIIAPVPTTCIEERHE